MKITNNENSGLIWYGIAVLLVLSFSIFPSKKYPNKWENSFSFADSIAKVNDQNIKVKLAEDGLVEARKMYSEFPYHARIQMLLGYYYFVLGNMDSTIYYSTKSLENGSGGVVNSIEPISQELLANATINKGISLLAKGDTNSAFKIYLNASKYNSHNLIINKNLAWFYLNQNKPDIALYYYYTALNNNKTDADVLLGLARTYFIKSNIDSAHYYANRVLTINPDNQDALNISNLTR